MTSDTLHVVASGDNGDVGVGERDTDEETDTDGCTEGGTETERGTDAERDAEGDRESEADRGVVNNTEASVACGVCVSVCWGDTPAIGESVCGVCVSAERGLAGLSCCSCVGAKGEAGTERTPVSMSVGVDVREDNVAGDSEVIGLPKAELISPCPVVVVVVVGVLN